MTREEFQKETAGYPDDVVVVSLENDVLTITCKSNFIFTKEAAEAPILVEKMYVNFVIL